MIDRECDPREREQDTERLARWLKGDAQAIDFIRGFFSLCHTWDDMVDGDRAVSADAITAAFWLALCDLPLNPFFRRHEASLHPVIRLAVLNWIGANELERGSTHDRIIAWTLRCSILDVIVQSASVVGGPAWAASIAADIRRYGQRERLSDYLNECKSRFGGGA